MKAFSTLSLLFPRKVDLQVLRMPCFVLKRSAIDLSHISFITTGGGRRTKGNVGAMSNSRAGVLLRTRRGVAKPRRGRRRRKKFRLLALRSAPPDPPRDARRGSRGRGTVSSYRGLW